ncbi:MAG: SpoIIE family protein phosphatase [Oscillospiraceae bacterium]|nr:SpoIIE family protein phosphatase [Oscillospiraceae bacterium]
MKMKTIRMKLLVPILCAIILGGLLMGVISFNLASDIVIEAFMEDGQRSAGNLREYIDVVISKAQLDLSALSVAPTVSRLLKGDETYREAVEGYIIALVEQHGIYNSIIVLNTDGVIMGSTSGSAGQERGDRDYFQASMRGEFYISEVEESRQTGRLATFVSIPVYDEDSGDIIGVAMTAIRLEELNSRYVIPVHLIGDHGYAMIATSDGTIIAHRDEDLIGHDFSAEALNTLLSATEQHITFETEWDGTQFRAFAEKSRFTDWYAIVICPVSEFYETTNNLARMTASLVAFIVLLLVLIILVAVRGVTTALSTTIRYADIISHGNLEAPLDIKSTDEVGVLADSLRDMVGKLKDMINVAEEKTAEAEEAKDTLISGIIYASKIQESLLPKRELLADAFSDHSVIWNPRDIVGGDIYWTKQFDEGTVLCVCDCTGHGTPGAFLTMLVVSALEAVVKQENYKDTADIIWRLERRIVNLLQVVHESGKIEDIHDGCDIAVLFVSKKTGEVTISSGNTRVFVCDGSAVQQIKGQRIFIGEGKLKGKEEIETIKIPANPDNKFYVASDGLFDQIGGHTNIPFGYNRFKHLILENHGKSQTDISRAVWEEFEHYRGEQIRRDDFQLISFKP